MVTWSPKVNVSEEVCLSQGVKGVHSGSKACLFAAHLPLAFLEKKRGREREWRGGGGGGRGRGSETEKEVVRGGGVGRGRK